MRITLCYKIVFIDKVFITQIIFVYYNAICTKKDTRANARWSSLLLFRVYANLS
jgi:hypothetical protein